MCKYSNIATQAKALPMPATRITLDLDLPGIDDPVTVELYVEVEPADDVWSGSVSWTIEGLSSNAPDREFVLQALDDHKDAIEAQALENLE